MAKTSIFRTIFEALQHVFQGKFKSFAKSALNLLQQNLGQLAQQAVSDVAASANFATMTDAQKRQAALDKLKQDGASILQQAKNSGQAIGDSVLSMLIELAVQKAKGTFAAVSK